MTVEARQAQSFTILRSGSRSSAESRAVPLRQQMRPIGRVNGPRRVEYALCVFHTIDELEAALREADYLPDRGLATALFLSLALEKPVLLEGEAGVGKTEAAKALSRALGARLI